jgi:hypothetical protein
VSSVCCVYVYEREKERKKEMLCDVGKVHLCKLQWMRSSTKQRPLAPVKDTVQVSLEQADSCVSTAQGSVLKPTRMLQWELKTKSRHTALKHDSDYP